MHSAPLPCQAVPHLWGMGTHTRTQLNKGTRGACTIVHDAGAGSAIHLTWDGAHLHLHPEGTLELQVEGEEQLLLLDGLIRRLGVV